MSEKLEKSLRKTASKLIDFFKKGECTERMRQYILDGEEVHQCPNCETLNLYDLSPSIQKCDECGKMYEKDGGDLREIKNEKSR